MLTRLFRLALIAGAAQVCILQMQGEEALPSVAGERTVSSHQDLGFRFDAKIARPATKLLATPAAQSVAKPAATTESDAEVVPLPRMIVSIPAVKLEETDVLTGKGVVAYAKQHYTSPLYRATFGPLSQIAGYYFNFLTLLNGWHPSEAEALALYYDDQAAKRRREVDQCLRLESLGKAVNKEELKEIQYEFRRGGTRSTRKTGYEQ